MGPVSRVLDLEGDGLAALVHDDRAGRRQGLARDKGIVGAPDRVMYGDELRAVRKGRLHLHVVDHRGYAFHHLGGMHDLGAGLHEVGNTAAVACALHHEIRDQRDRLRVVQLDAAFEPPPRHMGRHGDEQLVFFARRQVHGQVLARADRHDQRRGRARPRRLASRATIAARSRSGEGEVARATSRPFQALAPAVTSALART